MRLSALHPVNGFVEWRKSRSQTHDVKRLSLALCTLNHVQHCRLQILLLLVAAYSARSAARQTYHRVFDLSAPPRMRVQSDEIHIQFMFKYAGSLHPRLHVVFRSSAATAAVI